MGMFDYIKCEYLLPELPQKVIDCWEGAENVAFQTKDTPEQGMVLYKIDATGQLWQQHKTTRWVEPVDENSESIMSRLGHLETLSTWWEKEAFTGGIDFYESYHHDEYPKGEPLGSEEWKRFVDGWIEYTAVFLRGQLVGDVEVSRNEASKKLTDDEYEAQLKQWAESRKEWDDRFKLRRKEHPTPEQKLIDGIYNYVKPFSITISGQRDPLIEEIIGRIDLYRETHDRYYEKID
jgi:hypothetical protein